MFGARMPASALSLGSVARGRPGRCLPNTPRSHFLSLPVFDASLADFVPTCLGRNAPNAVLC